MSQISQNVNPANYPNQRQQYQAQRQRSINSPGAPASRQNSFTGPDGFPGPPSPTQNQFTPTIYKNSLSELRLLRQSSVPQATQNLPGE